MLDNLKLIHQRDAQDALGIAERQYRDLATAYSVEHLPTEVPPIRQVVYFGLGAAAQATDAVTSWLNLPVPSTVIHDSELPAYIGPDSLCIAISASGNNPELQAVVSRALELGANVAVIAGDGQLLSVAKEQECPHVVLSPALQPRFASGSMINALITLLGAYGFVNEQAQEQLAAAPAFLANAVQSWAAIIPTRDNAAKQTALEVIGRSVVIYSGQHLKAAADKWKLGFNESAKQLAWTGTYPQAIHGELSGWTQQPQQKPYAIIDLRSNLDDPKITKSFELSERLLSGKRPAPIVVQVEGSNVLEQLLWAMVFGDFVTAYTAILNGLNPTPTDIIAKAKKLLNE